MASIKPGRWKKKRWLELKHKSLFAYFKKKPQTEGTIVTRKLVSCILDDDFAKVTETDDKKNHGIESDSEKTIDSWNEKFSWLIVEGEGTCFKQNVNIIWANQGSTNFQKRVNNTNLEHVKAKKSSLIKKSTEAQHVHIDDGNFVYC